MEISHLHLCLSTLFQILKVVFLVSLREIVHDKSYQQQHLLEQPSLEDVPLLEEIVTVNLPKCVSE